MSTRSLTIHGHTFTVAAPYAEGHTLTAGEAAALNQTRTENISNQLRAALLKIKNGEGEFEALAEDERVAKMGEMISERDTNYEFGVRAAGSSEPRVTDPVEKEARAIARDAVTTKIKNSGQKVKDIAKEEVEAAVARVAAMPQVRAEAEKRVKARGKFDVSSLLDAEAAPAEA